MLGWFSKKIRQYSISNKIQEFMNAYKETYNKKTDSTPTPAEALLKHYLKAIKSRANKYDWYLDQSESLQRDLLDLRKLMAYEKNNIHNALFVLAVKIRNELVECAPTYTDIPSTPDSQSNPIASSDDANPLTMPQPAIVIAYNLQVDRAEPILRPEVDEQTESCVQRLISSFCMS